MQQILTEKEKEERNYERIKFWLILVWSFVIWSIVFVAPVWLSYLGCNISNMFELIWCYGDLGLTFVGSMLILIKLHKLNK